MPKGTCTIDGCDRYGKVSRGMCMMHYQRWSKADATKIKASPICSIEDCTKRVNSRGLCPMHYMQWRASVAEVDCSIEGCERKVYAREWCYKHYARWRVYGAPDERTPTSGYVVVHYRLRTDRGSAKAHVCVDCGNPAHHWSYDNADPDQKPSEFGPYSLNTDHYQPRCASCHKRFDNVHHQQPKEKSS